MPHGKELPRDYNDDDIYQMRPFQKKDFHRIWNIYNQIVVEEDVLQCNKLLSEADMHLELRNKSAIFVCESGRKILGGYWLKPNSRGHGAHVANGTYIVDPNYRRRGIGTLLCRHSLREAKRWGFRAIQFNFVMAQNIASRRLWERNGFTLIGQVPQAYLTRAGKFCAVCIYHRFLDDIVLEREV